MRVGFIGCGRIAMEISRLLVPTPHEIALCGTQEPRLSHGRDRHSGKLTR
jgi:hypothetical protein